jgi:hypothetical protein
MIWPPRKAMLPEVGVIRPTDGAAKRGLAGAGAADQRQRLAGADGEIDAVDGALGLRAAEAGAGVPHSRHHIAQCDQRFDRAGAA